MILRSPALILFVRLKDRISLYEAQDAVTEVFLTPPVDVEAVARSAAVAFDPTAVAPKPFAVELTPKLDV